MIRYQQRARRWPNQSDEENSGSGENSWMNHCVAKASGYWTRLTSKYVIVYLFRHLTMDKLFGKAPTVKGRIWHYQNQDKSKANGSSSTPFFRQTSWEQMISPCARWPGMLRGTEGGEKMRASWKYPAMKMPSRFLCHNNWEVNLKGSWRGRKRNLSLRSRRRPRWATNRYKATNLSFENRWATSSNFPINMGFPWGKFTVHFYPNVEQENNINKK